MGATDSRRSSVRTDMPLFTRRETRPRMKRPGTFGTGPYGERRQTSSIRIHLPILDELDELPHGLPVIHQGLVRVTRSLDQLVDSTRGFQPILLGLQVAAYVSNEL